MASNEIKLGSIVWADVCQPNGTFAGDHPSVVLSRQSDIDDGRDLQVAVCSTSFSYPLPPGWFTLPNLPGSPSGHEIGGLNEACVVKGTWLQFIPQHRVRRVGSRAPMTTVKQLLNWLRDIQQEAGGESNQQLDG